MAPFFNIYTQFINGYDNGNALLKKYKAFPAFEAFIKQCEVQMKAELGRILDLEDLLISPIQRIPRYVLLLSELFKYTPSYHIDFKPLGEAITKMKKVAEKVNESKREVEGFEKLVEIQTCIQPANFLKLVEAHRKFIREGNLLKLWGKDITEFHFFLFNDLLLYCSVQASILPFGKKKYQYVSFFTLENAAIEDVDNSIYPFTFAIAYPGVQKRFAIAAATAAEKKSWMQDIEKQISYRNSPIYLQVREADPLQPTRMRGYLSKEGSKVKSWKRRYFRLKGNTLFYYADETFSVPLGWVTCVNNEGQKMYTLAVLDEEEMFFELESKDKIKRSLLMQAESQEDLKLWVEFLSRIADLSPNTQRFVSESLKRRQSQ